MTETSTPETLRRAAQGMRDEWIDADRNIRPTSFYLAVADWLDATVERDDFCQATTPADCYVGDCLWHRALTVARAYLGEAS